MLSRDFLELLLKLVDLALLGHDLLLIWICLCPQEPQLHSLAEEVTLKGCDLLQVSFLPYPDLLGLLRCRGSSIGTIHNRDPCPDPVRQGLQGPTTLKAQEPWLPPERLHTLFSHSSFFIASFSFFESLDFAGAVPFAVQEEDEAPRA